MEGEKEMGQKQEKKYTTIVATEIETGQIIRKGDCCIFGGTEKLYYKEIKKKNYSEIQKNH